MNLRRFILAGLGDYIEGLEGGVVPSKEHRWIFEALHLEHSLGIVAFFVINLQTKEVLDAESFIKQKPCYDGQRKFETEVANDHYWVEPVFICSLDIKEAKSKICQLNGSEDLFNQCQASLYGKILIAQDLVA